MQERRARLGAAKNAADTAPIDICSDGSDDSDHDEGDKPYGEDLISSDEEPVQQQVRTEPEAAFGTEQDVVDLLDDDSEVEDDVVEDEIEEDDHDLEVLFLLNLVLCPIVFTVV